MTSLSFSYGPAEHASVTEYVVFTHTFDHSLIHTFQSFSQSIRKSVTSLNSQF